MAVAGTAVGPVLRRCHAGPDHRDGDADRQLADEIETVLWEHIVPAWYPRCLDTDHGGYWEAFSEDWTRQPLDAKFLVFQARMAWTPAAVSLAYPDARQRLLPWTRHGLRFLADKMWDREHGGFFDRVTLAGRPAPDKMPWKQLYSLAFGIYATATVHASTGDAEALRLAQAAFQWIDRHAHDQKSGGYFEHLAADGTPVAREIPSQAPGRSLPVIGRVGYKSMNAHIHILEALIALRHVWDDAQLTERLAEMFEIVRDKIVMPGGHLNMFCTRDFAPRDERSSFGHELEIAYLLMEASELLERSDGAITRQTVRRLVDHSLRWGWDAEHGGFYDEGPPEGEAERQNKVWWVQPEGLNGLLTAVRLFPESAVYRQRFRETWDFFRTYLVDQRYGGCFDTVDPAGVPLRRHKASPWKTAYHVTRGMLHAVQTLCGE
jgi:mannobiose 2-epimerase